MAYKFNESFFENINSEEKAYWLGFISADGGINIPGIGRDSGWILCINLKKEDKKHLEKFQESIGRSGPIYETDNCVRLQIGSEKLVTDLIQAGVGPRKSKTLKPWIGPTALQRHYWRGFFDGDGSISKSIRKKREITYPVWMMSFNGNFEVVCGFKDFMQQQGISRLGHLAPHYSIYKLKWAGLDSVVLPGKQIYSSCSVFLERKQKLFNELFEYYEERTSKQKRFQESRL